MPCILFAGAHCTRLPDQVRFRAPGLYPAGIGWDDSRYKFFVSSLATGWIGLVDDQGNYTRFASVPGLVSSGALTVDRQRERIVFCNSDPGVGAASKKSTTHRLAEVVILDYGSGRLQQRIALGRPDQEQSCAGLALAPDGSLFATDGRRGLVYQIVGGKANVLAESDPPPGGKEKHHNAVGVRSEPRSGFGGIVWANGSLLVSDGAHLRRVALSAAPSFHLVRISGPLPGEGLHFMADGSLLVWGVSPNDKRARMVVLQSEDDWHSARIAASLTLPSGYPVAAVNRDRKAFVLSSEIQRLFENAGGRPVEIFAIEQPVSGQ